jgi:muramidase (phage lysozyme)
MNSDAAGRWQFMGKYWGYYKQFLALPDFGKDSQRKWMIQLVIECQALTDIDDGNISLAISKCSSRWASLPGNHYGQPQQILSDLLRQYSLAGGILNEESTTSPA